MLQCKPGPALQKAPTPHQFIPQPRAVQPAWVPHWRAAEMEMGDSTVLFQTPLWLTGSCYLTSPATVCTQQATLQLAPLLSLSVSPQGDGDTDGDTPELPSSFGFHRDGSALKCQRDQFSTCISLSMAMSWSAALDCCIGWRAVLHFITLGTHLDTSIEMRAVGAGTVQEQPP